MAWANAGLVVALTQIPDEALVLAAPGSEDWSAGRIFAHYVGAAGIYVARLEGVETPPRPAPPTNAVEVRAIGQLCADYDARLRVQAALPDAACTFVREGQTFTRARSTLLAQSVHHATEHRAQIAGALAAHGLRVVDLDALDVWSFGDAEGLGA
jgi:uncharacterized damage-inducible protein DinB